MVDLKLYSKEYTTKRIHKIAIIKPKTLLPVLNKKRILLSIKLNAIPMSVKNTPVNIFPMEKTSPFALYGANRFALNVFATSYQPTHLPGNGFTLIKMVFHVVASPTNVLEVTKMPNINV
jgi:hypothetical protein